MSVYLYGFTDESPSHAIVFDDPPDPRPMVVCDKDRGFSGIRPERMIAASEMCETCARYVFGMIAHGLIEGGS